MSTPKSPNKKHQTLKQFEYSSPTKFASPSNVCLANSKRLATELSPISPTMVSKLESTKAELLQAFKESQSEILTNQKEILTSHENLLKAITGEINTLKQDNVTIKQNVESLKKSQDFITKSINDLKQEKLNNTIEISGISSSHYSSKPLKEIFNNLMESFQIEIDPHVVVSIGRKDIWSRTEPRKILQSILQVSFISYEEKMKVMNAKRQHDNGNNNIKLFFNHSLTGENYKLLKSAKKKAAEVGMVVSVGHGRIYIKKSHKERGVQLNSLAEVENFKFDVQQNNQARSAQPTQSNTTNLTQ